MAILSLTIFSNTTYATNSISGTKDRIKEIKIVEEINIEKLIRNKEIKKVNNETRNITTTSRGEVERKTSLLVPAGQRKRRQADRSNP